MQATRQAQPYRRGAREGGSPLQAMLKGRPAYLPNPADIKRLGASQNRQARRLRSPLLDKLAGR